MDFTKYSILTFYATEVSFNFEVGHVVINGNGAVAHCTVIGYNSSLHIAISSFIWEHNNTIIDLTSTRYIESGSGGTRRLAITPLLYQDAGSYKCTVKYVNLQRVSSTTETLQIASKYLIIHIAYSIDGYEKSLQIYS